MTASEHDLRARMLSGVPAAERRLSAAGVTTTVLEGGAGSPLVLLHGGIECGGAYWAPVFADLAARHRVVAPNVPGLGESDPVERLDPETFGRWLGEVLEQTCDAAPVLVAHSLLGTVAARFASEDGDRIARLVVCAAPGIGPYRIPLRLRVAAILFDLRPSPRNAERFDHLAFFDLDATRGRDSEWFAAFRSYTMARASVPHVKRTMRRLIGSATKQVPDAVLRRVPVPTSLVWGSQDRFVDIGVGREAAGRLGWRLHVIENCGHVPHIERPEAFVAAALA